MCYHIYCNNETCEKSTNAPIVALHGNLGSKDTWQTVGPRIAELTNRNFYAVDLRNHGCSAHTDEHGPWDVAEDLRDFTVAMNINDLCLMGHNMGGHAALLAALKYSEFVERLIILDVTPYSDPIHHLDTKDLYKTMLHVQIKPFIELDEAKKLAAIEIEKHVINDIELEYVLNNLRMHSSGDYYWEPHVETLFYTYYHWRKYLRFIRRYKPYTGKTLFICARRSTYTSNDLLTQTKRYTPNLQQRWMDTGHYMHLEDPDEFVRLVADFINEK